MRIGLEEAPLSFSRMLQRGRRNLRHLQGDLAAGDDEVDGVDHSCCLGDKRIFRPDISGKKGVFFPGEPFEGFSATWFLMGNPAEGMHGVTKFGNGGMATNDEGLAEGKKHVIFSDAVNGDSGRKKSIKKRKSVKNLIEVTGGESQNSARGASDHPAEMTSCGRATKFNDLLVCRITEYRSLATSSDQCESARFVDF